VATDPNFRATTGTVHASFGKRGDALPRLSKIAAELSAEHIASEAADLAQRLSEGRFFTACVGQFKRGKSTLINALVGDSVLPTGVIPVTTVATVLRFGDYRHARIRIHGVWTDIPVADLEQYVSEEHNPENAKGVEGVEVFLPSPLLRSGMSFVDTPGLGSVFAGNTAATEAFIPHIDAVIVVVGADPPLSGDELDLVETVAKNVRDIMVVLNKADRVTDVERSAARAFTNKVLEKRLGRAMDHIFEVSAAERIKNEGPPRDWDRLLERLDELVGQSGSQLIRRAGERGVERLAEQLLSVIDQERNALLRPLEESERRINEMRETLRDAETSMRDLAYLFNAEQQRLHDMFLTRRKEFLDRIRPEAIAQLKTWMNAAPRSNGPKFRRTLMHEAQQGAEAKVLPWLQTEQEHASREYSRATRRFVDFANEFLNRLAHAGVPELAAMPHALDPERGLRTRSHFRFYELITVAQPASPLRYIGDVALGLIGLYGSFERDATEFLDRLLEANSTRVQSDLDARVIESRQGLEADIRILLREVSASAERALEHARAAKAAGSDAVERALARLAKLELAIKDIRSSGHNAR
jgi:GTPase SAR1 family protein